MDRKGWLQVAAFSLLQFQLKQLLKQPLLSFSMLCWTGVDHVLKRLKRAASHDSLTVMPLLLLHLANACFLPWLAARFSRFST